MKRIIMVFDELEKIVLFGGFAFVIVIIFLQVVLRYVFNNSLTWVEELTRYLFVWLTWIGAARAVREDKHIRVTILLDKIGPTAKKWMEIVITLLCLFTFVIMTKTGFDLISQMKVAVRYSASLHVAMYYFYYAVPFGGILASLRYIQKLICVDIPKIREGAES